jgi:hypothetical protein
MNKIACLFILAALGAVLSVTIAADDPVVNADPLLILPNDSAVILHLNADKVASSTLLADKVKEIKAKLEDNDNYAAFLKATGFDVFEDLRSLTLAVADSSRGGDENFRGIIVAKGNYDVDAIVNVFEAEAAKNSKPFEKTGHEGVTVYSGEKLGGAAFLDSTTLVLGDRDHVFAAIDLYKGVKKQKLNATLQSAVKDADKTGAFWAAGYMAEPFRKALLAKKHDVGAMVISEVVSISLSLDISDGIKAAAKVTFRNEIEASVVKGILDLKLDLLHAFVKHLDPLFVAMADNIKASQDGASITLGASISRDQILETIKFIQATKEQRGKNLFGIDRFLKAREK